MEGDGGLRDGLYPSDRDEVATDPAVDGRLLLTTPLPAAAAREALGLGRR